MTEQRKYCGKCGATVVPVSRFCRACGTELAIHDSATAGAPAEQPSDTTATASAPDKTTDGANQPYDHKWHVRLEQVMKRQRQDDDFRLPTHFHLFGKSLGWWLTNQREQYAAYRLGQKSDLNREQFHQLKKLTG